MGEVASLALEQLPNPVLTVDDAKLMYAEREGGRERGREGGREGRREGGVVEELSKVLGMQRADHIPLFIFSPPPSLPPSFPPSFPPSLRSMDVILEPSSKAMTFKDLGIKPTPLEKVAFNYLYR